MGSVKEPPTLVRVNNISQIKSHFKSPAVVIENNCRGEEEVKGYGKRIQNI